MEDDPLGYLAAVWRDADADPALRVAAAKAALPYVKERRGAAKAPPPVARLVVDLRTVRDAAESGR